MSIQSFWHLCDSATSTAFCIKEQCCGIFFSSWSQNPSVTCYYQCLFLPKRCLKYIFSFIIQCCRDSTHTHVPFPSFRHKSPQWSELCQSESRRQEHVPALPHGCSSPRTLTGFLKTLSHALLFHSTYVLNILLNEYTVLYFSNSQVIYTWVACTFWLLEVMIPRILVWKNGQNYFYN